MVGAFSKILNEGSIWTGPIAVLSFILQKSTFLYFVHHGTKIYDKYIKSANRKIYGWYWEWNFSKKSVRQLYNAKYFATYANWKFLNRYLIKHTITRQVYSGRKVIQQVLCIFKVHHIVMLKYHHSSHHVFIVQ